MTTHTPTPNRKQRFHEISPAPNPPWVMDKDTIVSGAGIKTHQKYCIRDSKGNLVAVMLLEPIAQAIVSAVNACDALVAQQGEAR